MNIHTILAYGLLVLTLLVEAPKFKNVFSPEPYQTTSSKFYDLQTPPSPRWWLFIHLTHSISHVWLSVRRFLQNDWPNYNVFYTSHLLFMTIVSFQILKLSKLTWYGALFTNGTLLFLLNYCVNHKFYGGYLSILAVPVLLGVNAIIRTN